MQSRFKTGDMSHIFEDFFFICLADSPKRSTDLINLYLWKKIGVPIKPTTVITIYGMEIEDRSLPSFWQDKEGLRGSVKNEMSSPNKFTQFNTKALIDRLMDCIKVLHVRRTNNISAI